jgi:plasmid stabilization system protein ParE
MTDPYLIAYAPQAVTDLDGIIERIAKRSPQNGKRVLHRILANIDSLKTFPNRTVVRGRGGSGKAPVRTLPVQSWIIFFRVLEEEKVVRILRIRHGARRRPKHFE